jgi:polysaccharide biosynthesis protein PslH
MKVLFISGKDVQKKSNGGELCTNRNYQSFCDLIGDENVEIVYFLQRQKRGFFGAISKRINYFSGYYEGITSRKVKDVVALSKSFDVVFIDSSIHGTLACKLKKGNYGGKIITFFHNVEYLIKIQKAKLNPWKIDEIFVTRISEKNACRYSDHIITVNKRDLYSIKKYYNVRDVSVIPISLADKFEGPAAGLIADPPTFLFTGNNWYANIHGINWFIDNVLDSVNIKLQITGHNMDALRDKYHHPKIDFLGFVEDLPKIINEADFMLSPVFLGSGMKVKTCEALMYGKNMVGTDESFVGYDIDPDKVGAICNTKDEFIESINRLCKGKLSKFNPYSRKYYLDSYSFEATLKMFEKLLDQGM